MSSFLEFCETAEKVGATSSRLEKSAILGAYFRELDDADLKRAALFLSGHLFPLREGRAVAVGGAMLKTAIIKVAGADAEESRTWFDQRLVKRGDPGDVAEEAWRAWEDSPREGTHSLADLEAQIEAVATTRGSKAKTELVGEFLSRCTPLEAKYGVKMLAGDLRIGLKEAQVEDALARLYSAPLALVQRANMLTGDAGEVALLARQNRLEDTIFQLFHPLKFMLATPANELADVSRAMPDEFVVEDKFDGIRAQVHLAPHLPHDEALHGQTVTANGREIRVALFSRTLDEITAAFPDLHAPLAALLPMDVPGLVLDGEIVPIRRTLDGKPVILAFQELQKRLGRKKPTPQILEAVPVAFVAYDLLFAGENELETAFSQRRQKLETLVFDSTTTLLCESKLFDDVNALDDEFDRARSRGNEGLMVKDPRASYKPGRRGREWLKVKKAVATLDVVVTSVESGTGRRSKFYSDYTFAVRASQSDPTLLNVGKAYSGLTDAEIWELNAWFLEHTVQIFAHGRVRVVEPKIVLEIAFDRVQSSPRHKSGFALRFPRIVRLRRDKPVEEIDTLETVRELAN